MTDGAGMNICTSSGLTDATLLRNSSVLINYIFNVPGDEFLADLAGAVSFSRLNFLTGLYSTRCNVAFVPRDVSGTTSPNALIKLQLKKDCSILVLPLALFLLPAVKLWSC